MFAALSKIESTYWPFTGDVLSLSIITKSPDSTGPPFIPLAALRESPTAWITKRPSLCALPTFSGGTAKNPCRFCSANIDLTGKISRIDDKIKCDNKYAFIGLAGIKDYKNFIEILERDKTLTRGEIQVSNGFRSLMREGMRGIVFTWFDTGDLKSYNHALENYPNGAGYMGQ